jgi:hypothetical protein
MAFIVKNAPTSRMGSAAGTGFSYIQQYTHVVRPGQVLPATTTDIIFRVFGGRVLVHRLVGEVTTICSATATNLKVTGKKLDASSAVVGTAVDICANAAVTSKEVGASFTVLGSGAAAIVSNAGAGIATLGLIPFVAPQGELYITTDATNTGAMKWDIWYQPLDEGAYVVANGVQVAI